MFALELRWRVCHALHSDACRNQGPRNKPSTYQIPIPSGEPWALHKHSSPSLGGTSPTCTNTGKSPTGAVLVEFLLQDIGVLCVGTKCRCIVLPEGNSQAEMSEGNVGPGEAGHSQQSHQDMNFSCRDRVNSGCAKPTPFPSKTSCTYQGFSGHCIKPRRTRGSIPGPQGRWASLLSCSQHWTGQIFLP